MEEGLEQQGFNERERLIIRTAFDMAVGIARPDACDALNLTEEEQRYWPLLVRVAFRIVRQQRRAERSAQRKALTLLRTYLTPEQRGQFARRGYFVARGSAGGYYRLNPHMGSAAHAERHGSRWYDLKESYCFHDELGPDQMPCADRSLAHLLWLTADEPGFLAAANHHPRNRSLIWDSEWLRIRARVRRAERERRAA